MVSKLLISGAMFLLRWIARAALIAFLVEAATAGMFLLTVFDLVRLEWLLEPMLVVLGFGEQIFETLGPAWPVVPLLAGYAILEPMFAPFFRELFEKKEPFGRVRESIGAWRKQQSPVVASLQREAASADRRTAD